MFDYMMASDPKKRSLRGHVPSSLLTLVAHVLLITGLIVATEADVRKALEAVSDTTFLMLEEEEPEEEAPPEVVPIAPPPKGFQTVFAPIEIPTELPPVDLNERFDPRDFTGIGEEGGVFTGVEGGTGPIDLNQIFIEAAVDDKPERLSCPPPRYPPLLQQAGIEGAVMIEAVIDTMGHVEPGSIKVIRSDHRGFERAARDVVRRCLYRPGRVRGMPVRVIIHQPLTFTILR